jgi:hypothetical protein
MVFLGELAMIQKLVKGDNTICSKILIVFMAVVIVLIITWGRIKESGYYFIDMEGNIVNKNPLELQKHQYNEGGIVLIDRTIVSGNKKDGMYASFFMDANGNIVDDKMWGPCSITEGDPIDFPIIARYVDENKVKILDEKFNEIGQIQGDYDWEDIDAETRFSEGLSIVGVKGKGFGYINTNGEWIIEPQYEGAYSFNQDGFAWVKDSNTKLWGRIDKKGNWNIEPKYSNVNVYSDEGIWVLGNPETNLQEIIDINSGKQIIDENFFLVIYHGEGKFEVEKEKGGKAACINAKGEYITDYNYELFGNFVEGLALVEDGEKWGYINEQGEMVIDLQYDWGGEFSCGLAAVCKDNQYFYIDKEGKTAIELDGISKANTFSKDGYAVVECDNKYGIINTKGEWVLEPQFGYEDDRVDAPKVVNGHCLVYLEKGQRIKKSKVK